MDGLRREADPELRDLDAFYQRAFAMFTGKAVAAAFDVNAEDPRLRDRYGRHTFGQSALLARRLVEAGTPFVTVNCVPWDHHGTKPQLTTEEEARKLVPPLDRAIGALIDDLIGRGLYDSTLVVAMDEFGRTPRMNKDADRDHWGNTFSVLMGCGSMRMGQVIGRSSARGRARRRPAGQPAGRGRDGLLPPGDRRPLSHLRGPGWAADLPDREGRADPGARLLVRPSLGHRPPGRRRARSPAGSGLPGPRCPRSGPSIAPARSTEESSMPPPRATGSRPRLRLAGLLALVAWCAPCGAAELFRDDFSGFPPGWLTRPVGQLNAAIQEYHYLPHRGVPLGPWANAICHLDAWAVGEEDGHAYREQHTGNDRSRLMNPIFLTGDAEWEGYTVEVGVRPLSLDDLAGVVFRYHTHRHYYRFALTGGNRARLALRLPLERVFRVADRRELAAAGFPYDATR